MIGLPIIPHAQLVRVLAAALVLGAALATGYVLGLRSGMERFNDYVGAQAREAVKIVVKQGAITERVVTRYIKVKGDTQVVTKTIEKEVVRYVESNPTACLDAAWGGLHDRAALNAVPDAAPGADAESRAPTAAQALTIVTENYAACHRTADRLDALQAWVRGQGGVEP